MTEATQHNPAPEAPQTANIASTNPAVARCLNAWEPVFRAEMKKYKFRPSAAREAGQFYRDAMPPLSGYDNIRDFIACTAHGILIGAIEVADSSKLLYAAQVALSTIRHQPAPKERASPDPSPLP